MFRKILQLATVMLLVTSAGAAQAAPPPGFAEGVRAYNGRQYRQAVSYFAQAGTRAPADPMIHYYMGLSYQGMNQMSLAKQEYQWVASCRTNPTLQNQAARALLNLSKYSTSYGGGGSHSSASATTGSAAAASGPSQQVVGRLQILYFWTDW